METERREGRTYQIRVEGRLDESWSDWFHGMVVKPERAADGSPITTLTGPVADQSTLRGILTKLWDLNLVIVSVIQSESGKQR